MKKQSIGIGLLGLGVIGGQIVSVLMDRVELLTEQVGCPLVLKRVKVRRPGLARPLVKKIGSQLITTDAEEFFGDPGIDIVIEVMGGENPALQYLKRALSEGKHVVTANKELIAKHGAELLSLAQKHNVGLRYEASVGGGIPLVAPFQYELVANEINGIYAIINGTTNYILTRMEKEGIEFSSALTRAQELGYAESNPENDIEGVDAAYKLAILASLAFQRQVLPHDVYYEGISRLSSRDFRYARELGFAIKLLAIAKRSKHSIEIRVHPVFISEDSLLAKVDGVNNAILVDGDLIGRVLFYGQGAGPSATSSAVIADTVAEARNIVMKTGNYFRMILDTDTRIKPMDEIETRYYLRMSAADRSGVLAQITRVFGDHGISIASIIQKEADAVVQTAEAVLMTHPAQEAAMQQTLAELERLEVVKKIGNFVRVEDLLER